MGVKGHSDGALFRVRKTAALLSFAALAVAAGWIWPGTWYANRQVALWILLLPLGGVLYGLWRQRHWARWVALGSCLAVAVASLHELESWGWWPNPELWWQEKLIAYYQQWWIAVGASTVGFLALIGRTMFDAYEGRAEKLDWRGARMFLVRWTIILNIATALLLYLFAAESVHRPDDGLTFIGTAFAINVVGVFLLARQKTLGLFVLGLPCVFLLVSFVDVGSFEINQPFYVFPGLMTGWACLFIYARPMVRFLTQPDPNAVSNPEKTKRIAKWVTIATAVFVVGGLTETIDSRVYECEMCRTSRRQTHFWRTPLYRYQDSAFTHWYNQNRPPHQEHRWALAKGNYAPLWGMSRYTSCRRSYVVSLPSKWALMWAETAHPHAVDAIFDAIEHGNKTETQIAARQLNENIARTLAQTHSNSRR